MCRRSQLASIILALILASPAIGVERLPEGAGDTLLFPFYTTENGLDTYINVSLFTYESGRVPILRVRFLDARTTEVVNSFNVYPDRYENWQAALTFDEFEERVELRLSEGSCTLDEDLNVLRAGDDVGIGASVGMIEVYALGTYPADGLESDNEARCDLVAERWAAGGVWDVDPLEDVRDFTRFESEAGKVILGEAWMVNVSEGFAASYTPITLRDLQEVPVHTHPRSPSPNLAEADPIAVIDGMDVIPPSGEGIDAIAMVLPIGENYALVNDVVTSNIIGARTDWVISYPLAPYKNYKPFELTDNETTIFCEGFGDRNFGPEDTTVASHVETRSGGVWTWGLGESNFYASPFSAIPPGPEVATLCHPINVVAFGDRLPIVVDSDSPLLAEEPDPMMPSPDDGDSITLSWSPFPREFPEESGIRRPIFAFRLTTFINGTLNDGRTLANYAVLRKHHTR